MAATCRVALLQLRAFDVGDAEASLKHTLAMIDEAARQEPDIIVTPEMTYPAYFIGRHDGAVPGVRTPSETAAVFAAKAREHAVNLAVGMALEAADAGGRAPHVNVALLLARDGREAGRYAKSFLWHFDQRWFAPGDAYPVFETDVARVGMLVCADGRMPEIARSLALGGAQIILDLTAWVSGARHKRDLTSSQRAYLMQTHAAENGVWIAAADKVGIEQESIVYCGGSCVIDSRGRYAAQLGPDEEGVLVFDVPVEEARPPITRRPELYAALKQPTETLPVERTRAEPLVPGDADATISVVQMTMPPDGATFIAQASQHVARLALQDARLVLFPATPSRLRGAYPHDEVLAGMRQVARDARLYVCFTVSEPDADGWRTMYLIAPDGEILAKHRQSHKPPGPRFESMPLGDEPCRVVETPFARLGMIVAAEGAVPEVARSLMLRGAEVILWASDNPSLPMGPVARTRADENRVYVACAAAPTETGATMIVEPSGTALAQALEGAELAVSASVNRTLARLKQRAPGTDVVRGRKPETYALLTSRAQAAAARVV